MYLDSCQLEQVRFAMLNLYAARWNQSHIRSLRISSLGYWVCLFIILVLLALIIQDQLTITIGRLGWIVAGLGAFLWIIEIFSRKALKSWPSDANIHKTTDQLIEDLPVLDDKERWILDELLSAWEERNSMVMEEMLGYAVITPRLGKWPLLQNFHELAKLVREQQRS